MMVYPLFSVFLLAIYLTISSERCTNVLWQTIENQHGSDHFPIFLKTLYIQTVQNTSQKWKYSEADWKEYKRRIASVLDPNADYTAERYLK